MIQEEITAQFRNIYLDILISDRSEHVVPARALIDTGAEATFIIRDFADTHFHVRGEDHARAGSERIHIGTIYFGSMGELPVLNIEFRVRDLAEKLFTAQLVGHEQRIPFHVIVGMDVLEHLDFAYFHRVSRAQTRTFFAIWTAGDFVKE